MLPSGKKGRAQVITSLLISMQQKVRRRLNVAEKIVRCPKCLPDTESWYISLSIASNRLLSIVKPLPDVEEELVLQKPVVEELENAELLLRKASADVIQRSQHVKGGLCGYCGRTWESILLTTATDSELKDTGVIHMVIMIFSALLLAIFCVQVFILCSKLGLV